MTPDIQKVDEKIKKKLLEAHKKFIGDAAGGAADGATNEIRWWLLIFEMVTPILLCLYA